MIQRVLDGLDRQQRWTPVLLRLAIGATFILHGYDKVVVRGAAASAEGIARLGVPLGAQLAPLVPWVEFVGGMCVALGLLTRVAALMQANVMAFAILFVHGSQGFKAHAEIVTREGKQVAQAMGWEWQALLLAGCLTLAIGGAGCLSLDALIRRRLLGPPRA